MSSEHCKDDMEKQTMDSPMNSEVTADEGGQGHEKSENEDRKPSIIEEVPHREYAAEEPQDEAPGDSGQREETSDEEDDEDDYSKEEEVMLPGFRFHRTDEELIGFYLRRKVKQEPIRFYSIKQIDIYKNDPWDFPSEDDSARDYFYAKKCRRAGKVTNEKSEKKVDRGLRQTPWGRFAPEIRDRPKAIRVWLRYGPYHTIKERAGAYDEAAKLYRVKVAAGEGKFYDPDLELGVEQYINLNYVKKSDEGFYPERIETTAMWGGQAISTAAAIFSNNSNPEMSRIPKMLWHFQLGCIFVSIVFSLYGFFLFRLKRRNLVARVLIGIGYTATVFGILSAAGMLLPEEFMLVGTASACTICLPALIGYAMK